ncbi:transcription intermediary factor 1-alpha-like [Mytilus trossulus]|uniref:transcription intermediary factor 1-alpha-like n=1 Tax=Mytilus trossulus TaxID=6551 RepID=UPI003004F21D
MNLSMSSKLIVCGVCEYRNINKPSVVWCSECDEGLCKECQEHHAASKVSRDHSCVQISEYQKLPANILEITHNCPKHNEKYQIFCKKHDSPCCRRCVVESHDQCGGLNAIDDVIQNVKSSNAFLEIEQMLVEVSENLQRIRKGRQDNIQSLKENKTKIELEIKETRILINDHLDKLQESLLKELYAAEEKENKKISCLISSIQEKEMEITEYLTNFDKIKQHASDLQTFVAMKHIQQDVSKNEQFIESMLKEDKTNNVTLSFKKEKVFENLPTTLIKMGPIIVDTMSSDITLTRRKNKQAQIMLPSTHVPTIDDIKLTLKQTVNTMGAYITDCSLLPDGRMIFSGYESNKIYVIKTDGSLDFTLQTGSCTSHMHFKEDIQKLVVTSGIEKSITIIDMKNRKTEKLIQCGSSVYGIAYNNGQLFYNGYDSGLCVVSLDNDSVTQLENVKLRSNSSIAIWSDQLYYLNIDDSVVCCDLQGKLKWKSELASFLRSAQGIAVDNHGRVYISGFYSHNVVVISPDGHKHRVLLLKKDGIKNPQSLFFDRTNNKLLISNQTNEAFLYDVSNK